MATKAAAPKIKLYVHFLTKIKFIVLISASSPILLLKRRITETLREKYAIPLEHLVIRNERGYDLLDNDHIEELLTNCEVIEVEPDFRAGKPVQLPAKEANPAEMTTGNRREMVLPSSKQAKKDEELLLQTQKQKDKHRKDRSKEKSIRSTSTSEHNVIVQETKTEKSKRAIVADNESTSTAKSSATLPSFPVDKGIEIIEQARKAANASGTAATEPLKIVSNEKGPTFEPGFKGFAVKKIELEGVKTTAAQHPQKNFVPLKSEKEEDSFEAI